MTATRKAYPTEERVLKTLDCCIYCGMRSVPLQDEHIIPFGLHGRWVLAKASCHKCASVTSRFERNILREGMLAVRTALEYPTRRPRERPRQYPLIIKQDGRERTIDVPIEEYLPIIVLPVFDVPGYVEDRDALRAIGLTAPVQVGGPSIRQLAEKYGSDGGVQVSYQGYALAQLLAKIAYGFAIAKYGLGKIQVAYVVPGILEKEKNIGRWVGCDRKLSRFLDPGNEPHAIRIFRNKENDIIGRVRLFAEFETPEYIVNVGRLKESVAVHLPKDRTKRRGKEAG